MAKTKTETPGPGDKVKLTCEVVHAHSIEGGKYYGNMRRLVVRIVDGPEGFALGDLRLVEDDSGEWINRPIRAALDAEAKPDLERMTVAQLRREAKKRGMKAPSKVARAELIDWLRNARSAA